MRSIPTCCFLSSRRVNYVASAEEIAGDPKGEPGSCERVGGVGTVRKKGDRLLGNAGPAPARCGGDVRITTSAREADDGIGLGRVSGFAGGGSEPGRKPAFATPCDDGDGWRCSISSRCATAWPRARAARVICLVFAGLALVLSAIGIYGVLAASLAPSLRITRIRPASALRYE